MKTIQSKDFIRLVEKNGYSYNRCKGSHSIYLNKEGRHISVPKNLNPCIALRLIKQCNLKEDENN